MTFTGPVIIDWEDAKEHFALTPGQDDDVIFMKLRAAEAWIGAFIGSDLATLDPLPPPIREAILMLAGHLFENREATLVGVSAEVVPFGVHDLLAPYREWVF